MSEMLQLCKDSAVEILSVLHEAVGPAYMSAVRKRTSSSHESISENEVIQQSPTRRKYSQSA